MKQLAVNEAEMKSFLKKTNLFHYLSEQELKSLYGICCFVQYEEKEQIIQESEINPTLFIICKGIVNVSVHEKDKNDVYIASMGEGDVFGEAGLFINMKRTADVCSFGKTVLIQIERSNLMKFFSKYPLAGVKILMIITHGLLHKLRESNQEVAEFHKKSDFTQAELDELIDGILKE